MNKDMTRQTIIILEGHDKSGKSTIAEALSKRISLPIFKMSRPKYFWDPLSFQTYATESITQMLEQTGVSVILDRSFPSDYMYSTLFIRPYDYERGKKTDERFATMNALIVYCYKNKSSYLEDPEDASFISTKDYDKMKTIYSSFLRSSRTRSIEINTSDEDLEKQLTTIINNI
jgi:thymidylate kinase